jgi:hypothetical protein
MPNFICVRAESHLALFAPSQEQLLLAQKLAKTTYHSSHLTDQAARIPRLDAPLFKAQTVWNLSLHHLSKSNLTAAQQTDTLPTAA